MMKTLFIGGIKSGKSKNAEIFALKNRDQKPIYLATNEFFDKEMHSRINRHKLQRKDNFKTIEEPLHLVKIIKNQTSVVLVECMSMWINNMLFHGYKESDMIQELQELFLLKQDIIFVINDVSCSIIQKSKSNREFVDINGKIAQLLALECSEVYNTIAGISIKIK